MSDAACKLGGALAIVVALLGVSQPSSAAPPGEASSGEAARGEARSEPVDTRARLLLLTQEGELEFAVERAIATELNDVEVEIVRVPVDPGLGLAARISIAERAIDEQGALAALWVEPREDGLMIYVVVAEAGMLGRPVAGEAGELPVEEAAVVVRHFASELLEGGKLGLASPSAEEGVKSEGGREVGEPDDAPAASAELEPTQVEPRDAGWRLGARTRARVQFGYAGHAWAPQQRWVSSVEFSLGVRVPLGIHVDLAYALVPRWSASVRHVLDSSPAEIDVRRFPPALQLGYQHAWDRSGIALDAALRFTAEFVERKATSSRIDTRAPLVVVPILEPRVQFDWLFSPPVSLLVGLGLRVHLIDYSHGFASLDTEGEVVATERYLEPWTVAPALYLGLGVSL